MNNNRFSVATLYHQTRNRIPPSLGDLIPTDVRKVIPTIGIVGGISLGIYVICCVTVIVVMYFQAKNRIQNAEHQSVKNARGLSLSSGAPASPSGSGLSLIDSKRDYPTDPIVLSSLLTPSDSQYRPSDDMRTLLEASNGIVTIIFDSTNDAQLERIAIFQNLRRDPRGSPTEIAKAEADLRKSRGGTSASIPLIRVDSTPILIPRTSAFYPDLSFCFMYMAIADIYVGLTLSITHHGITKLEPGSAPYLQFIANIVPPTGDTRARSGFTSVTNSATSGATIATVAGGGFQIIQGTVQLRLDMSDPTAQHDPFLRSGDLLLLSGKNFTKVEFQSLSVDVVQNSYRTVSPFTNVGAPSVTDSTTTMSTETIPLTEWTNTVESGV